jgi:hypothetical protein
VQVFPAVADQIEKHIVRLWNSVELAGDGRFLRERTDARAASPQPFVSLVPIGKVAHYVGKAL